MSWQLTLRASSAERLAARVLQDSAWPVPWRASQADVKRVAEKFAHGESVVFAGSHWEPVGALGAVRRSYSHEQWQAWFEAGNARAK